MGGSGIGPSCSNSSSFCPVFLTLTGLTTEDLRTGNQELEMSMTTYILTHKTCLTIRIGCVGLLCVWHVVGLDWNCKNMVPFIRSVLRLIHIRSIC
jgi:hypothetical protein